jgi:hypothetical protein
MGNKLRLTGKQLHRIISEALDWDTRSIPGESMRARDPRRAVAKKMAKADQVVADAVMLGEFTGEHADAVLRALSFDTIPQKFSPEDMREIWTQMGLQRIVNRIDSMIGVPSDELEDAWDDVLGVDVEESLLRIATDFEGLSTLSRKAADRGYTEDPLMILMKKNPSALHVKDLDMDSLD